MSELKNLYIITGKGGVGKTTLSMSFCKYLEENSNKAVFYSFFNPPGNLNELSEDALAQKIGIKTLPLNLFENVEEYIGRKLKSKMIASWILKTPFFKALLNMLPGFSYLIYLGKLLEVITDSHNETIIVLDSPSSGHALTMLEAAKNFSDIFKSGIVFDDTIKMLKTLTEPGFAKVNIVGLPTQMALNETKDLQNEINQMINIETGLYCNDYLPLTIQTQENLPDFLLHKKQLEEEALLKFSSEIKFTIPHSLKTNQEEIIQSVVPYIKNFV